MLVGLLGKNAILIVEFAVQRRREGVPLWQAAVEGGKLRFRPIQMTSFAFIAGLIPLVYATGAGAIGNRTIGTTAAGGMLVGTVIGVLVIPGLYYLFAWLVDGRHILADESDEPLSEIFEHHSEHGTNRGAHGPEHEPPGADHGAADGEPAAAPAPADLGQASGGDRRRAAEEVKPRNGPDGGFLKAMVIGLAALLAFLGYLTHWTGELPRAEHAGVVSVWFMLPAAIAGAVVNRRRWSWFLIAAIYSAFLSITFVLVVLVPALKQVAAIGGLGQN
jgi:hypothetical protein